MVLKLLRPPHSQHQPCIIPLNHWMRAGASSKDMIQAGLGCVNSWGSIALPEYQVPYQDYEFTFILSPIQHCIDIQ